MTNTVLDAINRLIEVAWRRRTLIALPIALMIPLSVLGSRFLPQTYVAKALLAMQETGSDNPLFKSNAAPDRVRDRAPGLQALLKSDRVLVNALHDILGDRMPADPRSTAEAAHNLDLALSFEMIGTDFLELQLKGSNPHGLGQKLEAITARFLESLIATDLDSTSAMQVLLDKRRADVAAAEQALARFKEQLGARAVAAIAANQERLKSLQGDLQSMLSEMTMVDAQISTLKGSNAAPAQLEPLESRSASLHKAVDLANVAIADLSRGGADSRSPEGQLRRLQHDVSEARALLDSYAKRFPTALSSRSLQVLNAPERIRVIDAPHDPEFPATSRARVIIVGTLLGFLMAAGLAAGAELFDQRLRQTADFEAAAGVPVVARLPAALTAARPDDGDGSHAVDPNTETTPQQLHDRADAAPELAAARSAFGRRSVA